MTHLDPLLCVHRVCAHSTCYVSKLKGTHKSVCVITITAHTYADLQRLSLSCLQFFLSIGQCCNSLLNSDMHWLPDALLCTSHCSQGFKNTNKPSLHFFKAVVTSQWLTWATLQNMHVLCDYTEGIYRKTQETCQKCKKKNRRDREVGRRRGNEKFQSWSFMYSNFNISCQLWKNVSLV